MLTLSAAAVALTAFKTVSVPYDAGANRRGSALAPERIVPQLGIRDHATVRVDRPLTVVLDQLSTHVFDAQQSRTVPIVVGGDHTIACATVSASHRSCLRDNATLGVLWCDAHADFNTMHTSPTKNLHGVPVAVLCGHTLPMLRTGSPALATDQFAFYGVRDVDDLESERMRAHSMRTLQSPSEVETWLRTVDAVHVSFDVDCLDLERTSSLAVNTPVPGGPTVDELSEVFRAVRDSRKLVCADVVEVNPTRGGSDYTARVVSRLVRDDLLGLSST